MHTTAQDCTGLHFELILRRLTLSIVPLYQFGKGHFGAYFDPDLIWT